jgi:hypothetical protein
MSPVWAVGTEVGRSNDMGSRGIVGWLLMGTAVPTIALAATMEVRADKATG